MCAATSSSAVPHRWRGLEEALAAEAMQAAEDSTNRAAVISPVLEESAAMARFLHLATLESQPKLRALLDAAATRSLPYVIDESHFTLGGGRGQPLIFRWC